MASDPAGPAAGRHVWLKRFALAAVSAALAVLAAEALLALHALPLSEAAARYVYGCYEPGQPRRYIHSTIRPLKLRLHRPDFEADCYFFGYHWRHRSDGFGWRNPENWDTAEVVVLGDSMVYGHGVEEEQTTTHFLRELLDRRVVNMGITGASPVSYLAYLRNFALPLRPEVLVVLFFGNDLEDIERRRSPAEIGRFVESGKGRETQVFPRSKLLDRLRQHSDREPLLLDRLAVFRWVEYQFRAWRPSRAAPDIEAIDDRPEELPAEFDALTPPADEVLDGMAGDAKVAYVRRALAMMAESSSDAGASLVVGHLGRRTKTDWLLRRVLRESSVENGFHYFETPVLEGRYRLPHDGHLSAEGHRRLAEAMAAYLTDNGLL